MAPQDPSAAPLQLAGAHVMKLARELDACKRAATRLEDEGANAALLRAEGRVQQLYQELKHLKRPSEDACQESPAADARADKVTSPAVKTCKPLLLREEDGLFTPAAALFVVRGDVRS